MTTDLGSPRPLERCPQCGAQVSAYVQKCPQCGASAAAGPSDADSGPQAMRPSLLPTIITVILILLVAGFLLLWPADVPKERDGMWAPDGRWVPGESDVKPLREVPVEMDY